MHKELWNAIKNLAINKEAIGSSELALANYQLSADVFEAVKDHYLKNVTVEPDKKLPPWL